MIFNILNKLNKLKKFPYFIVTPLPYAIGTASDHLIVAVKQASILNKKLMIIVPTILKNFLKYNICNKYFFSELKITELSKKDKFIKNIFIALINIQFLFNRSLTIFFDKFTKIKLSEPFRFPEVGIKLHLEDTKNFDDIKLPKYKPYEINLSDCANSFCLKKIKEIGISEKDKFVCISVRDNLYRNDKGRREYRNAEIANYKEAIFHLLSKGYWVIRLGQLSNKKLDINHPKFLDYPFSKFKNYCLDLYLLKNCKFMISTQNGLFATALLLNKPTLLTNAYRLFETRSANKFSRVISKKPFWKKNKKFIPLENYLNLKYLYHHIDFIDDEIDFEENSSNEILEATKEFLESIENKSDFTAKNDQINFNKFMLNSFKNHYYDKSNKNGFNLIDVPEALNLIIGVREAKDYYCNCFLKKNFKFN